MAKKGRDDIMEEKEEELELDEGVMQQLLHDDNSSSTNDDNPSSSSSEDEESINNDTPQYSYNYTPSKEQLLLQKKSLDTRQMNQIKTINEAASQLFHVLHKYGDTSSSSSGWDDLLTAKDSPWKDNVNTALEEIVAARTNMLQAWDNMFHKNDHVNISSDDGKQIINNNEDSKREWWEPILRSNQKLDEHDNDGTNKSNNNYNTANNDDVNVDEQQFHPVYMEYAANAFASELEALRKGTLEQLHGTSKKKRGGKEASSLEQPPMEVDLDPTQHSFVVPSSKRFEDNADDDGAKAAAAAAKEIDVQVLSDMLSSGSYCLSSVEKNMLLKARQRGSAGGNAAMVSTTGDGLSLHERRKRELGLLSDRR